MAICANDNNIKSVAIRALTIYYDNNKTIIAQRIIILYYICGYNRGLIHDAVDITDMTE